MELDFLALVSFLALFPCSSLFTTSFLPLFVAPSLAEESSPEFKFVTDKFMEDLINGHNFKANVSRGEAARLYVCQGQEWEPPCVQYIPDYDYSCERLHPLHAGRAGSLFVDQGIICRLATYDGEKCRPFKHVAWMEIGRGWRNLTDWEAPEEVHDGEKKTIGELVTHFMCAQCSNCPVPTEGRTAWPMEKSREYNTSWTWGDW